MAVGVRRPPGRHNGRFVGKWTSNKTGQTMWWESSLERAHLRPLEWDRSVSYYVTQPLTLKWVEGSAIRRWTPDIFVVTRSRTLVEVKPHAKTLSEEFKQWAAAAGNAASAQGYMFRVWTEHDLPPEPRRSSIDLLLRYRSQMVPVAVEDDVKRWLRDEGPRPISAVVERINHEQEGLPMTYALMARHAVGYDIDRVIGPELILKPAS